MVILLSHAPCVSTCSKPVFSMTAWRLLLDKKFDNQLKILNLGFIIREDLVDFLYHMFNEFWVHCVFSHGIAGYILNGIVRGVLEMLSTKVKDHPYY